MILFFKTVFGKRYKLQPGVVNGEIVSADVANESFMNSYPVQDPQAAFDIWVASKPSYYTEEHRQSFLAGFKYARGEK